MHLRRHLCLSILLLAWKGSRSQGFCPCRPSSAPLFQCSMSSSSFLTSSSLQLCFKASNLSLAPICLGTMRNFCYLVLQHTYTCLSGA